VTADELRRRCLDLPGATSDFPFGPETEVFRVEAKIFALVGGERRRVNLKCDPGLAPALREAYVSVVPGYHMNKRHWNTVELDGDVPDDVLGDLIEDSYDLIVSRLPKAVQRGLGWTPAVD
jgi:predicted DNA-binding protein (MmcQ/YjbR family)